jgi:hypothetical protein
LSASSLTAEQRSQRARIGAHALHSRYDSRELSAPGRAKFLERFENEVDPDRILPEFERRRRAEHAKKAYFTRLSLKAAEARSRRS